MHQFSKKKNKSDLSEYMYHRFIELIIVRSSTHTRIHALIITQKQQNTLHTNNDVPLKETTRFLCNQKRIFFCSIIVYWLNPKCMLKLLNNLNIKIKYHGSIQIKYVFFLTLENPMHWPP